MFTAVFVRRWSKRGMLSVSPPPRAKLFFSCVPQALSLIDVVLVLTPALMVSEGSFPALAIFSCRSLDCRPSMAFLISGRLERAAL